MMEKDDILIKRLFSENKQEIEDRGFTRRVMRNLPDKKNRVADIILFICLAVVAALLVASGSLQAIVGVIRETLVSIIQTGIAIFDPKMLLLAGAVLFFCGLGKIYLTD